MIKGHPFSFVHGRSPTKQKRKFMILFYCRSRESVDEEMNSATACKRRIHHLKVGCLPPTPATE